MKTPQNQCFIYGNYEREILPTSVVANVAGTRSFIVVSLAICTSDMSFLGRRKFLQQVKKLLAPLVHQLVVSATFTHQFIHLNHEHLSRLIAGNCDTSSLPNHDKRPHLLAT